MPADACHRTAGQRTAVTLAPHATRLHVEWTVYPCGCISRGRLRISDPPEYVAASMRQQPAAPAAEAP